jgi:hypothetical protein
MTALPWKAGKLIVVPLALLVAFAAATPGFAIQAKAARPSSIQDRFATLGNGDSGYGIRQFRWVPAAGGLPTYAFVLGCLDCEGATYDANGTLTNPTALARIPTSWILRVPENYRQRLVAQVPFAEADQTIFRPYLQALLAEGDAVAVMDHPSPGFARFPYDQFIGAPFQTTDYTEGYEKVGRVLKKLLRDVVSPSLGSYLLSSSRGTLLGGGLLAGDKASPFDGSVLLTGGDGELPLLRSVITSLRTDGLVPFTHLAHQYGLPNVTDLIGKADPEYRAQVLAGTANALDYDLASRPERVQKDWQALSYDGHLQGSTIVIQGLHDTTVWPGGTVDYGRDVVAAGSADNLRLFFFKAMGHAATDPPAPPFSLYADAVHALDRWNTEDVEPGPLSAGLSIGTQASCTTLGYGSDPGACFNAVLGSGF